MAGQTTGTTESPDSQADKQSIGSEIIKAREVLGLTQAELASRSQVSLSAIKGYETGRNFPGAREIKLMCQVLRISPNRLLFGRENPFSERAWHHFEADKQDSQARVEHLLPLLSSVERDAIYRLAYGIAAARHGVSAVSQAVRSADLESGINHFIAAGIFDPSLHAKLLVNTAVARNYASAILVAADETDSMNSGTPAP